MAFEADIVNVSHHERLRVFGNEADSAAKERIASRRHSVYQGMWGGGMWDEGMCRETGSLSPRRVGLIRRGIENAIRRIRRSGDLFYFFEDLSNFFRQILDTEGFLNERSSASQQSLTDHGLVGVP